MRAMVLLLAVLCGLGVLPPQRAGAEADRLETSELWIETARGGRFSFTVELAVTSEQQAQGLMFRESMAPDAGMLFVFDRVRQAAFWMKNTLIPLDMLFIGADGRIVNIAERTTPLSTESVPSAAPVQAVLEINGGLSRMLGIAPGDRVIHELLGP